MNHYQRHQFNQSIQNQLIELVERMFENEQKSSTKSSQEREENPTSVGEAGRKDFDHINPEEELECFGTLNASIY